MDMKKFETHTRVAQCEYSDAENRLLRRLFEADATGRETIAAFKGKRSPASIMARCLKISSRYRRLDRPGLAEQWRRFGGRANAIGYAIRKGRLRPIVASDAMSTRSLNLAAKK